MSRPGPAASPATAVCRGVGLTMLALALVACDRRPKETPPDSLRTERQQMERARSVESALDSAAKSRLDDADRQGK